MCRMKILLLLIVFSCVCSSIQAIVSYDDKAIIINGRRRILMSGSIHYPRSTPQMWPDLIKKAKDGGLDVIQTYIFWNGHEPSPGKYNFEGRYDLVKFIKLIQEAGLYVHLRIGPYVCAEWNFGGFPVWLKYVPGMSFRTDNEPFKSAMQRFTAKIVNMMKSEKLFEPQGGPIIMSQIENEYGPVEWEIGAPGKAYSKWAAQMADGLKTGVPWIMCKQEDAPDPMIDTCNGFYCEKFTPNKPYKPKMFTELWTGWFTEFGGPIPTRPVEDIAYAVARFIQNNGSFVNYYMYHGGTNFGRTSASFIITSYYDQAPLDEYGIIRQPKYGHLKDMHAALKLCSQTLLYGNLEIEHLGDNQDAYVYTGNAGECAAFLVNNSSKVVEMVFRNTSYTLPAKSVSILADCKNVVFNTGMVNTQVSTRSMQPVIRFDSAQQWQTFSEAVPQYDQTLLRSDTLLEQMNTTKDTSDYLWYTMRMDLNSSEAQYMLRVNSLGHVLCAYVNGALVGSAHGIRRVTNFTYENTISLQPGINNISFLSIMVGLPDSGAFMERRSAGLREVLIQGLNYTISPWGYQVGLLGEKLSIYTDEGSSNVSWSQYQNSSTLTWYKTTFDEPDGTEPIALNLGSMGKGQAWINGQSIGRYWVSFKTISGSASQTWYNVPRSFLKPNGNSLVLFEEEYANPLSISLDTISINKVCGRVSDSHPARVNSLEVHNHYRWRLRPRIHLRCPNKRIISKIVFASHGNPSGDCDNYSIGKCHSSNSQQVIEKACLGRRQCVVSHTTESFGGDPCPGTPKTLLVDARCE